MRRPYETVAAALKALAEQLLSRSGPRIDMDMVGDTAALVQASGLDLGELGDRLMDAWRTGDPKDAIAAMSTTNWHMWERLPKKQEDPPATFDEAAGRFLLERRRPIWDHSTYRRLYYEVNVNGTPSFFARAGARRSSILAVAYFSWSSKWNRGTPVSAFTKTQGPSKFVWRLEWNRDVHKFFEDPPRWSRPVGGWRVWEVSPPPGVWSEALAIYHSLDEFIDTTNRLVEAGLAYLVDSGQHFAGAY
jgi:hypothetical protein